MEKSIEIIMSLPSRLDGLLFLELLWVDKEATLQVDYPALEYFACETLRPAPGVDWDKLSTNLLDSWFPEFSDCQPHSAGIDDSAVIPLAYWRINGQEQLMGTGASSALVDLLWGALISCKLLPQQELLELALAGIHPDFGLRYVESERTWRWFGSSYGVREHHILAWTRDIRIEQPAILDASNLLCHAFEPSLLAVIQDTLRIRSWKVPQAFLEPLRLLGVPDEHVYLYDRSHAWYNEETGCTAISRKRNFRLWDVLHDTNVKTTTR